MRRHGIDVDSGTIRAFCRKWRITTLEVFGSVLRDDFRPDSDIDFLATYDPGARWSLTNLLDMEDELAALVGRPVDIVDRADLDDPDANPYRKAHILRHREPVYVGR